MNESKLENDSDEELLGRLASEFSDRCMAGENPSIEDYAAEYPQIAEVIRDLFPALKALQRDLEIDRVPLALPGKSTLGDFTIVREIGRGGMGIVCEAIQRSMHRAVALKILPQAAFVDPRRLKRFQNEVRAVATLDHPHIVSIHSVGEDEGIHYYSMQLVRGASLSQVLARLRASLREGHALLDERSIAQAVSSWTESNSPSDHQHSLALDPMSASNGSLGSEMCSDRVTDDATFVSGYSDSGYFRAVAQLVADVAGALEHAHQHGIVHRDIKPANLLISQQGQVRVTDFGVARIAGDVTLSATCELVGTLRYMAPEQALGKGAVDHRADIYSLGATLYEMLTLQPVFTTEDRLELLQQIAHTEPKRPRAIEPRVPVDLQTIALKALNKDSAERYPSALEMQQDLQRYLDHRPILARPPGVMDHVVKGVRRHPWASAVVLMFVLSLTTFAVMMTRAARKAEQSLETTTEFLYASDMRTASQVLAAGEMYRALELLKRYEPKAGEIDRRDFVWHYLNRRLDRDEEILSTRHWGAARWIDRSVDGRWFATGHELGAIVLWTSDRWNVLGDLKAHRETVSRVQFLADNRRLVSADESGLVCVWDIERRRLLAQLQCPDNRFDGMAITPDGNTVILASDRRLLLWNGQDREPFRTIEVNVDRLMALAVSPDGKFLASVDRSNHLRIWNLPSWELALFENYDVSHSLFVSLSFLPDSRKLLIGTQRGEVGTYDLETRTLGPKLPIHKSNVYSMDISPDGRSLLTSSKDMTVKLTRLDQPDATPITLQHPRRAYCATFTGDGRLVSTSRDETIRIWPLVKTSHERHAVADYRGSSAIDAEGKRVLTSNFLGSAGWSHVTNSDFHRLPIMSHSPLVLWANRSQHAILLGAEIFYNDGRLRHDTRRTMECDIDGDGDLDLVSSMGMRGILLVQERLRDSWSVPYLNREAQETGWRHVILKKFHAHYPSVWFAQTTGQFVAVNEGFRFFDDKELSTPRGLDAADLDQDGTYDLILGTVQDETVRWYANVEALRLSQSKIIAQSIKNQGDVRAVDLDGDSLVDVAIACTDGLYWCRQLADRQFAEPMRLGQLIPSEWAADRMRMDAVDIDHDGRVEIVVAGATRVVVFGRNADGAFDSNPRPVNDLRDVDWLLTLPSHAAVWGIRSEKVVHHFHLPLLSVRTAALSEDDQYLATASAEKVVSIWKFPSGEPYSTLPPLDNSVGTLTWSSDGRWLFIGAGDEVHVWDRVARRKQSVSRIHENTVSDIAVSHRGDTLATVSHDLTVRLWTVGESTPRQTLLGHKEHPMAVAFSPDDRILATIERTGTVYLWHVETGQLMVTLNDFQIEKAHDVQFRDDRTLVATGEDHSIHACIWFADSDVMVD